MFCHSFIAMKCVYIVFFFFTVNSSVDAARSSLNAVAGESSMEKALNKRLFPKVTQSASAV